jgi:hypothetical protein
MCSRNSSPIPVSDAFSDDSSVTRAHFLFIEDFSSSFFLRDHLDHGNPALKMGHFHRIIAAGAFEDLQGFSCSVAIGFSIRVVISLLFRMLCDRQYHVRIAIYMKIKTVVARHATLPNIL